MHAPPDLATVRAALWARAALRAARRGLASGQMRGLALPPPPPLPAHAVRGVDALLRRRRHTCLEGALVRQRWLAAHGEPRAIAIGVSKPSQGFAAHAWLEGEGGPLVRRFHELTRLQP